MPKNIFQNAYLYLRGCRDNLSLGKCFHYGRYVEKDLALARSYYLEAAQQGNTEAFDQLHILAGEEGRIGESFYYLGKKHASLKQWQEALTAYKSAGEKGHELGFYAAGLLFKANRISTTSSQTISKDLATELSWYRKAAAAGSKHGLDALLTLSAKEPKAALHLAQMYENGEMSRSLSTAVDYYEKANQLGDPIAAYRLGQLYERGEETFKSDQRKAFAHYLVAAKQRDKRALEGLERIVQKSNDSDLQLQLADIYEASFREKALALKCFKALADQGHKTACDRMHALANRDARCAYELARSYEREDPGHKEKAYAYYALAMRNCHSDADNYLTSLAKSGDREAQYALGYFYYHPQKNFDQAIHWCLLASEQQHHKASAYIRNTVFPVSCYLALAENYEAGKTVRKSKDKAFYFYEKATATKNKEAAFRLGQDYQRDNKEEKAFDYFIKAAQWGHKEALCCLIRLSTELNPHRQLQLANLYRNPPFSDSYQALYWSQQANMASDSPLSNEALVKLIEDTGKDISFKK